MKLNKGIFYIYLYLIKKKKLVIGEIKKKKGQCFIQSKYIYYGCEKESIALYASFSVSVTPMIGSSSGCLI
jgi:hypothetical protein